MRVAQKSSGSHALLSKRGVQHTRIQLLAPRIPPLTLTPLFLLQQPSIHTCSSRWPASSSRLASLRGLSQTIRGSGKGSSTQIPSHVDTSTPWGCICCRATQTTSTLFLQGPQLPQCLPGTPDLLLSLVTTGNQDGRTLFIKDSKGTHLWPIQPQGYPEGMVPGESLRAVSSLGQCNQA